MKIAFIIPSLANKGPIIMVQSLVQHLVLEGYSCQVYYFDAINELSFACPTQQIKFLEAINFNNYQVIHSHLFRPDVYCAIHQKKIKRSGAKLMSTIHTAIYDDLAFTYGNLKSQILIFFWEAAWKRIHHLVVLTDLAKGYYNGLKAKEISVINNGRDLPEHWPALLPQDLAAISSLREQYVVLGTVCSIDERKGLTQLIELLVIRKNFAVVVVGDGALKESLIELAQANSVAERFKVIGFREEGYRYIPLFDLYLLPSRSEGMPLALLEAMALKVPIVASAIPSLTGEFSSSGIVFFQLDDIDGLGVACDKALASGKFFSDSAYNYYIQNYTLSKMGARYIALYKRVSLN
ncbi:glycosyltransferase [Pedobacter frigiditerrae]|uniref:glycosyltransferase n=1 Tax=Pedobacter frigiditerrae TaxID=2530452 RepID=UPI0029308F1A|nr:glycosyltransferase [Pedobacter frigiditerrae]